MLILERSENVSLRSTVAATFDPFPSPLAHHVGEIKGRRNVVIDALYGGIVQWFAVL